MATSGISQQLLDRFGSIRAQLFPRIVLLELNDAGLRGQVLRGGRPGPLSLEAPLPPLTCRAGMPLEPEPLGDMIGDLLVREKLLDAFVMASLPPEAVEVRMIVWPAGLDPDDPERELRHRNPELGLGFELAEACMDLTDVPGAEARSLVAFTPRRLVQAWIQVFNFAGARLERLAPAQSCQLVALQQRLADCGADELVMLLSLDSSRARLLFLRDGALVFEHRIRRDNRSLVAEIDRCQLFYRRQDPAVSRLRLLLCDPLPAAEQTELEIRLGVGAELVDHGDFGSLVLQGLAVPDFER
ncbi:MAG: hypothetical protein VKK97_07240 [Synechococcaceae cyanobacterium]|nr:hypothetical protein [Synechococcaceae cyanobacterium]